MRVAVDNRTPASSSYRAARVRSLFNATDDQATRFQLDAQLDIDDDRWRIGVVVGPSGSGKSSIGRALWDGQALYDASGWPDDQPVVDAIAPDLDGGFDVATAALAAAGLGDVPVWLRPYRVLSMGQQFRADLARILAEKPQRIVFDEFTSVVDRQIAKVGAGAFGKAWKRTTGQAVLLTCHYDVLDWLEPDWVFDTATKQFQRGTDSSPLPFARPRINLEIRLGGWDLWPFFKPHHYLDSAPMVGGKCYVGFIDGEPVCHLGVGTQSVNLGQKAGGYGVEARACRLVVLPEWQGAGVGMRFLNHICQLQLDPATSVLPGRSLTTRFHTSHPQLVAALRRDKRWRQLSAVLHGGKKARSLATLKQSNSRTGKTFHGTGFGGHLRAVQGFRYYGERGIEAAANGRKK